MHFEGGTVAQIVYSGDQADRGQQQVVYTADGSSYTSVESAEHTLVYIHPADGTQVRRGLLLNKALSNWHVRHLADITPGCCCVGTRGLSIMQLSLNCEAILCCELAV